ncbi:diguanylate cyclase [Rhodanobacter sp. AS-Z3]|uniref:GGDEF domain-containing response regulator n=1 Tax=Rhodanobacter sp. AS-Z3 TaxID=3031330 RepID=UPI00247B231C|nr:diguanylate cyclase [Rhodanobacter sp. AS-Z3]WEN15255.1 diguanylate cyclase [Rhodanobacter sp. AS-Z3]
MTAIEQLRINGGLPSPKGVALAIMQISRREDATLEEISRLVQTDPVTASRLLHMANAANVAGRPIASVPDAIVRLGLTVVRQLAMGFSLVDQYRNGACAAFDYSRFWSRSLLMAVAMQELGKCVRIAPPDELFACGLLAQIGYLALATLYPEEYARFLRESTEQTVEQERQHLHIDHNELTSAILQECGIPNALAEPVLFHEAPETSGFAEGSRPHQLTHLFHQAKRLADMSLAPADERHAHVAELMLLGGKIGLDADELSVLIDNVHARWRNWSELLNVPDSDELPFAELISAPREVLAGKSIPTMTNVLWVSGARDVRMALEKVVGEMTGQVVHSAEDAEEGLALAVQLVPQIVIVDARLPGMDGWAFCHALRATSWGQSIYLIMLANMDSPGEINQAAEARINDCLSPAEVARLLPLRMSAARQYVKLLGHWEQDRAQLKQFSAELALSNRKLQRYALIDQLTGLQNRRAGMEALTQAWSACERSGEPVTMMMIDIDKFKEVNDTHGHAVGDKVLGAVAEVMRNSARKEDTVCRMGGEEFLVICRNANLKSSLIAAERLRKAVAELKVRFEAEWLSVTVSIGIACKEPGMADPGTLVNAADKALYAAKAKGRNRICHFRSGKVHLDE